MKTKKQLKAELAVALAAVEAAPEDEQETATQRADRLQVELDAANKKIAEQDKAAAKAATYKAPAEISNAELEKITNRAKNLLK